MDEEFPILDVDCKIDMPNDETGAPDTPDLGVSDAVGNLTLVNILDAVGKIGAESVAQGASEKGHGTARVGAISEDRD